MAPAELSELKAITDALSRPPDAVADIDLVPELHQAIAAGTAPRRRRRWIGPSMGALALAAAVLLAVRLVPHGGDDASTLAGELTPRSNADPGAGDMWSGIQVYRLADDPGAEPVRVTGAVSTRDGLLVSYTNLGDAPFSHLMVFVVDARGTLHWLYPAPNAGHGASIAINAGVSERPLPDRIRPGLAPGPAAIVGLFSRARLSRSEVESMTAAHPPAPETDWRLAIDGVRHQLIAIEVAP